MFQFSFGEVTFDERTNRILIYYTSCNEQRHPSIIYAISQFQEYAPISFSF